SVSDVRVTPQSLTIVAVALEAWLCVQLFRRHGLALERVRELEAGGSMATGTGLPIGANAPAFEAAVPGRPTALVFSDPGCSACAELEPKLEQPRAARGEVLGVTLSTSR